MELLCNKCESSDGYVNIAAPCSQCKNQTDHELKLCKTCALKKDQCQSCLGKLDGGFTADDLAAVDKAQVLYDTTLAAAEAAFTTAFEPLKEAVAAFTKSDAEAFAALQLATKDTDAACAAAREALLTVQFGRKATTVAQKAYDDACALSRQTRESARVVYLQTTEPVTTKYASERDAYTAAQEARKKSTTKAERKYDAMVRLVIDRRRLERAYLAEIARIEALQ